MYAPKHYSISEDAIFDVIKQNNFGTLLTTSSVLTEIRVVRTPFMVRGRTTLFCHVAAGNQIWKTIAGQGVESDGAPVVCLFDGPHHYISPAWYKTEQDTPGSHVPTWNHASVTVKGYAKIVTSKEEKLDFLNELVKFHETQRALDEGSEEWSLAYVSSEKLLKKIEHIAVIKIEIGELDGTLKMNQKDTKEDQVSVANALTKYGNDQAIGTAFLTRNSNKPNPLTGIEKEMRNATNVRKENGWGKEGLKVKDILLGAVLVTVPIIVYRYMIFRK